MQPSRKDIAINLRANLMQRVMIDAAAHLLNKSRTEFILEAAFNQAEQVLIEQRIFWSSSEQFNEFEKIVNAPVKDNPSLKALLQRKAPWEK